jgi:hypothetical protein
MEDRVAFCLSTGPTIAVVATVLLFIVIPGSLFLYFKRDRDMTDRVIRLARIKVFYIPIRAYYLVITLLILISFILSVISVGIDDWV